MAPFKLKFRMGSSRSTSQEHDPDPQVNEALLNKHSTAIGASSSTIDSADCTSLGSLGTNERKSLLPPSINNKTNNLRLGYLNPNIAAQCAVGANTIAGTSAGGAVTATVPQTPPPSYEHVLEENTRLANTFDLCPPQRQRSTDDNSQQSRRSSSSLEGYSQCTDPDCLENIANEQHKLAAAAAAAAAQQRHHYPSNNNEQQLQQQLQLQRQQTVENAHDTNCCNIDASQREDNESDDNRKESIDSRELLLSTNMTSSSPSAQAVNPLDNCNGECQNGGQYCSGAAGLNSSGQVAGGNEGDFCDPLMNRNGCCSHDNHHYTTDGECEQQHHQSPPEYADRRSETDSEDGCWDTSQMSSNYQQHHQQQQQQQQQQQYEQQQYEQHQYEQHQYEQQQYEQQHYQQQQHQHAQQEQRSQTPEIISNKSSKEIYKDLAKQWGITCKMSDGCRCMECQSHYFDCEYDDNEHHKTDGGLGAGTPMFISEVMHGSACTIL